MIKITFDRSITTGSTAHTHFVKSRRKTSEREKKEFIIRLLVVFDILPLLHHTHNKKALIEFIENDIEMLCYSKLEP